MSSSSFSAQAATSEACEDNPSGERNAQLILDGPVELCPQCYPDVPRGVVLDWKLAHRRSCGCEDSLNSEGPYPSLDELTAGMRCERMRGPTWWIMPRHPTQPNLDAWFDEITPEAQKRVILLDWDANGLYASMGWAPSARRRPSLA